MPSRPPVCHADLRAGGLCDEPAVYQFGMLVGGRPIACRVFACTNPVHVGQVAVDLLTEPRWPAASIIATRVGG